MFMLSAKASDQTYSQSELFDLYMRPASLIFISLSALFILSSLAYEETVLRDLKKYSEWLLANTGSEHTEPSEQQRDELSQE